MRVKEACMEFSNIIQITAVACFLSVQKPEHWMALVQNTFSILASANAPVVHSENQLSLNCKVERTELPPVRKWKKIVYSDTLPSDAVDFAIIRMAHIMSRYTCLNLAKNHHFPCAGHSLVQVHLVLQAFPEMFLTEKSLSKCFERNWRPHVSDFSGRKF